ncbi:MAG: hypothetical protein COX40_06125 [Candidatus Omnitrophica bacterium CG23_combo_of_CG06-09_8_20_14_all_40_11]|nr:MAG: hypothetical protein COX40_06125 [Candidatus Omnitrophica bacterium CG23_combo_of_CG06-09_8_20_14_all_40_11]
MENKTQLYEAFCAYLEACNKLSLVLWDSVASEDLLKPYAKHAHFVNKFHSVQEYEYLLKVLEDWDTKKPDEENITKYYHEYYGYKNRLKGCLEHFFVNTGIYDIIISGEGSKINTKEAFSIFFNQLSKTEIEFVRYGEVFPLRIEMEKDKILEFSDFSLVTDMIRHGIDDRTKFVFLLKRFSLPNHLGMPKEGVPVDMVSFSIPLLLLNLYFEHPLCIRVWHESYESLLSTRYQTKRYVSESYGPVWNNYFAALSDKYHFDAIQAADVGYTDWDKFDDFISQKAEEFIKSGQAPVNYLKREEVAKFEEFIMKVQEFLKSDIYKTKKYLEVATHYFLMAHERPDLGDNLLNYVIALESLYCGKKDRDETAKDDTTKQFRVRIPNLLAENKKGKIKDNLCKLYDIRSRYVHGDIVDFNGEANERFKVSHEKFYLWLRNIVRLSILSFFSLSKIDISRKEIHQILDTYDTEELNDLRLKASSFLVSARASSLIIED